MKKLFLLLLATVAIIMTVNAQTASFMDPSQVLKGASTQNLAKSPKKAASDQTVYYNRPAGGFAYLFYLNDYGTVDDYDSPVIVLKPNSEYTFKSVNTVNDNWTHMWDVFNPSQENWYTVVSQNLTINSGEGWGEVPVLKAVDENNNVMSSYQLHSRRSGGFWSPGHILAGDLAGDFAEESGFTPLLSSKTFTWGGRLDGDGDYVHYPYTYYYGLNPWGNNEYGWYFGKNGGYGNKHYDGIAQAFEKPEHPYILKQVVMVVEHLNIAQDCEMTCKIYKLANGIPAYQESSSVSLPEVPGELIATGRAQLSPYPDSDWDLQPIVFTLYGNDGNVTTPTINDAILIAIDGYNSPEMDALTAFTAVASSDEEVDEGFGELAYFKYKDDTMDEYEWRGLNNFFSSSSLLQTGFSIFITTEFSDEEMETTDAPFITWTAIDGILTVTATGNGNVVLNVGNETANGNGSATITVDYDIHEGIEVGATAYAQEVGKLASEVVEESIVVNAVEMEKTDAPVIEIVEITEEYVTVHVGGNGTLTVWVNGQEVTLDQNGNYKLLADEEQDMIYIVTAIAQEPGKDPSEIAELTVEVPANQTDTGISDIAVSKQVVGVRYFNAMGQEVNAPDGMTIVVTTYSDGTTSTVKVIK